MLIKLRQYVTQHIGTELERSSLAALSQSPPAPSSPGMISAFVQFEMSHFLLQLEGAFICRMDVCVSEGVFSFPLGECFSKRG